MYEYMYCVHACTHAQTHPWHQEYYGVGTNKTKLNASGRSYVGIYNIIYNDIDCIMMMYMYKVWSSPLHLTSLWSDLIGSLHEAHI